MHSRLLLRVRQHVLHLNLRHRHPKSHSCQIIPSAEPKNAAARALLAKNFPSTSKTKAAPLHRPSKIPTDPIKLAQYQKIENMKLRGRAVPADSKDKLAGVPQSERVHMKVLCEDGSEKAFWVRNVSPTSGYPACLLLSSKDSCNGTGAGSSCVSTRAIIGVFGTL